jgi:hypothetical protein
MFNKPAVFAVPLRRSIGGASVVMALWAAGGVAAMAQTGGDTIVSKAEQNVRINDSSLMPLHTGNRIA